MIYGAFILKQGDIERCSHGGNGRSDVHGNLDERGREVATSVVYDPSGTSRLSDRNGAGRYGP